VSFSFTAKQKLAMAALTAAATHCMLFGGGRSGKTFLYVRGIVMRALKAAGSRHLILRFRFNHVKASVILDTFPKVMQLCFPDVDYELSRTDWYATLPNGSEVWFGGLDDSDRMEKILGLEFVTIFLNECSQISWAGVQMVVTRLAQLVMETVSDPRGNLVARPMKPRMWYDCNPPSKMHWTFRLFKQKVDPETKAPLASPDNYVSFQINPRDNVENLSPEYLSTLAGLGQRMRRRFEHGEFSDATPNALFDEAVIDRWRVTDGVLPDMVRVVVSVDPSGAGDDDNADNDEIGITVNGLGTDGKGYLIEDISVKAGPATWGKVAVQAYQRHGADVVVGEKNFGGAMVRSTIAVAASTEKVRVNFKEVTASRGKVQRAEPFSALYEDGKIRHVGIFPKVEDELCAFSTTGYTGPGSPNRADAAVWGWAELFPAIVAGPKKQKEPGERRPHRGVGAWMG
jgi:Phage terminase large subunit/Terminase RNaseH-like domain